MKGNFIYNHMNSKSTVIQVWVLMHLCYNQEGGLGTLKRAVRYFEKGSVVL